MVDARIRIEAAENILSGCLDDWMRRRQETLVVGARKGLDAAIGMALFDKAAVPVEEIAQAAGVSLEYVGVVGARLKAL